MMFYIIQTVADAYPYNYRVNYRYVTAEWYQKPLGLFERINLTAILI